MAVAHSEKLAQEFEGADQEVKDTKRQEEKEH